jgi:molecular chaperone DnaJ
VDGGGVVGATALIRYPSKPTGLADVEVAAEPAFTGRGVGSALARAVEALAAAHGATLLRAELETTTPGRSRSHAAAASSRHAARSVPLDLTTFREGGLAAAVSRVRASGIRLFSPAEAGDGEEPLRALYAINRIASIDDPASDGTFPGYETWRSAVGGASAGFRPEGVRRRLGDRFVGLAVVSVEDDLTATSDVAGVDRVYRRRGIANALRLLASVTPVWRGDPDRDGERRAQSCDARAQPEAGAPPGVRIRRARAREPALAMRPVRAGGGATLRAMATAERDLYELLGVARDATETEIKRAFRRLARELHPDVSDHPEAGERFRELAEAYEVLSNAETRRLYDRYGHAGLRRGGFTRTDFDLGNLSDIFAAFFGDGAFGGAPGGNRPARGADVTAVVEIGLAEAFGGTSVDVGTRVAVTCVRCRGNGAEPGTEPTTCPTCGGAGRLQRVSQSVFGQFVRSGPCPRCEGTGRIVESPCRECDGVGRTLESRTIPVDIPAGIHDGQRIRLRGEGHAGAFGGGSGDVFVLVRVDSDERLLRDGDDLVTSVELTMVEAALGATVEVPTPEGSLEVEVPAGTQPGELRVVKGRGMPSLDTGRRGDLRVHVDVRVPTRLTPEQRTQLEQLAGALGEESYRRDDGFFERLRSAFR